MEGPFRGRRRAGHAPHYTVFGIILSTWLRAAVPPQATWASLASLRRSYDTNRGEAAAVGGGAWREAELSKRWRPALCPRRSRTTIPPRVRRLSWPVYRYCIDLSLSPKRSLRSEKPSCT